LRRDGPSNERFLHRLGSHPSALHALFSLLFFARQKKVDDRNHDENDQQDDRRNAKISHRRPLASPAAR
jgi:hypothetical protein